MNYTFSIYDGLGFVGAVLILFGFYRTSIGKWTSRSLWYELDNIIGPFLLIVYAWHLRAYISVVINLVWAIVAFRGLTSFVERYRGKNKKRKK